MPTVSMPIYLFYETKGSRYSIKKHTRRIPSLYMCTARANKINSVNNNWNYVFVTREARVNHKAADTARREMINL